MDKCAAGPQKGLLKRLLARERQGGQPALWAAITQERQVPIAHLLELTPQAQGCVFLGFSACGNFLFSYSFDAALRFQLEVWMLQTLPVIVRRPRVSGDPSAPPLVQPLVAQQPQLRLVTTAPLFPHAQFESLSSMGDLVDGTAVRLSLWQCPSGGGAAQEITMRSVSSSEHEKKEKEGGARAAAAAAAAAQRGAQLGVLVVIGFLHERMRAPQPYYVSIIPAPTLDMLHALNPAALRPPAVPSGAGAAARASGTGAVDCTEPHTHHRAAAASSAAPSVLATIGGVETIPCMLPALNGLHTCYMVTAPYPLPSVIGLRPLPLSALCTPPTGSYAQGSVRDYAALGCTAAYRLALNAGDGLHILTLAVRPPGVTVPPPCYQRRGDGYDDDKALLDTQALWPVVDVGVRTAAPRRGGVAAAAAAVAVAVAAALAPGGIPPRSHLLAAHYSLSARYAVHLSERLLEVDDRGCVDVAVGLQALQQAGHASAYGGVWIATEGFTDAEATLHRCVKGRLRDYDARLVRMLDTTDVRARGYIQSPADGRGMSSSGSGSGSPGSAAAPAVVCDSSGACDARYLLLCCVVDHQLQQDAPPARPVVAPKAPPAPAPALHLPLPLPPAAVEHPNENEQQQGQEREEEMEERKTDADAALQFFATVFPGQGAKKARTFGARGRRIVAQQAAQAAAQASPTTAAVEAAAAAQVQAEGEQDAAAASPRHLSGTKRPLSPSAAGSSVDSAAKEPAQKRLSLSPPAPAVAPAAAVSPSDPWADALASLSRCDSTGSTGSRRSGGGDSGLNTSTGSVGQSEEDGGSTATTATTVTATGSGAASPTAASTLDTSGSSSKGSREYDIDDEMQQEQEQEQDQDHRSGSSGAEQEEEQEQEEEEEDAPLAVVAVEAPVVRSKLLLLLDSVTGAMRMLSLTKLPSNLQPAFDVQPMSVRGGQQQQQVRTLSSLTSQIVTATRAASSIPWAAASDALGGTASSYAALALELSNDAVLASRSLSRLINPARPLALYL